jgi:hypothetical protein
MDLMQEIVIESGATTFGPGESIAGRVRLATDSSWRAQFANLCLEWYTEGKGDQDRQLAVTFPLAEPGSDLSPVLTRNFVLTAPMMPWSYGGRIIKLNWCLALYVQPVGGRLNPHYIDIQIHPSHATR